MKSQESHKNLISAYSKSSTWSRMTEKQKWEWQEMNLGKKISLRSSRELMATNLGIESYKIGDRVI